MGAFYVGQRVKKVRGTDAIGLQATVAALAATQPQFDFQVTLSKAAGTSDGSVYTAGTTVDAIRAQWEPILPPGLESDAEIDALYQPESLPVSEAA